MSENKKSITTPPTLTWSWSRYISWFRSSIFPGDQTYKIFSVTKLPTLTQNCQSINNLKTQLPYLIYTPMLFQYYYSLWAILILPLLLAAASPLLHNPYKGTPSFPSSKTVHLTVFEFTPCRGIAVRGFRRTPRALPSGDYGRRPGGAWSRLPVRSVLLLRSGVHWTPAPHWPPAVFVKAGETFINRLPIQQLWKASETLSFFLFFFRYSHYPVFVILCIRYLLD